MNKNPHRATHQSPPTSGTMGVLFIDFETRSECDLKTAGAWAYSCHSSTEILCMAWAIDEGPVSIWVPGVDIFPAGVRDHMINGGLIEAHNVFFERSIIENVKSKIPADRIHPDQWRCSMAKAARRGLPQGLGELARVLGVQEQKDDAGHSLMMKLSRAKPGTDQVNLFENTSSDLEKLYEYCKQDVRTERAVSMALPDLEEKELKIWQLDQDINSRGFHCDIEAAKTGIEVLDSLRESAEKEIFWLTGGAVETVGQVGRIKKWLSDEHDIFLPSMAAGEVEDILSSENLSPDARRVLDLRLQLGKAGPKKMNSMIAMADERDNRIRGCLRYYGAHTGRWSGSGVQVQNFPRIPKDSDQSDIDSALDTLAAGDPNWFCALYSDAPKMISTCLRGMICAAPGHRLIGADFSSIEARVLLWLAGDEVGLGLFRSGKCLYRDMASTIFSITADEVTDKQRDLGKIAILGLGYGMGYQKFAASCDNNGIQISESFSSDIVKKYRKKYNKITRFWRQCEAEFLSPCILKSGRELVYNNAREENEALFFDGINPKTKKWGSEETYGGKLAENVASATARDILAEAMMRVESAGYPVVLSVHDEIICEVPDDFGSVDEFVSVMTEVPSWAEGCPIDAKGWEGKRYAK